MVGGSGGTRSEVSATGAADQAPPVLHGLELVRVSVPLARPWASRAGELTIRDSLLVRAVIGYDLPGGRVDIEGWGECGAFPAPTYSPEHTAGALEVSRDYFVPALLNARVSRASDVSGALQAIKGNNMAKTAFEGAILDAELRAAGAPMAERFAELSEIGEGLPRQLQVRATVPAGVAVGLHVSSGQLLDEVATWVDEGYRRVKLKIRPGQDVEAVSAVRERWPSLALFADANGAYAGLSAEEAARALRDLEPFDLACIEQPLGDDDLLGHAELARDLRVPICLDEALTSLDVLATALRLGACSVVNIKPGRLGGYFKAVRAHDLCQRKGVPVWCGGMVETGIGRAANIALASLPNFSLPGDLSATGRFFDVDLTSDMPLQLDGTIRVPGGPGLGVSVDADAVRSFSTWRQWCPA